MQQLIDNLSKQPTGCIILTVLVFLYSSLLNYLLLDSLLKMHRSKSALKKLKKEYTLLQKLSFLHFKGNCRHAVKFCNGLIVFQKIGWGFMAIYLFVSLFFALGMFSATVVTWLTVALFVLFDIPAFVINRILVRPFLFGWFKAFSFEKYHNTANNESLI